MNKEIKNKKWVLYGERQCEICFPTEQKLKKSVVKE